MPTVTKTYKILKFQIISFGLGVMKKKKNIGKVKKGKDKKLEDQRSIPLLTYIYKRERERERESHRNLVKN